TRPLRQLRACKASEPSPKPLLPPRHSSSSIPVTPPPGISTLSLHDALPICQKLAGLVRKSGGDVAQALVVVVVGLRRCLVLNLRSEEHTSELQSQSNLVCRLLLENNKL